MKPHVPRDRRIWLLTAAAAAGVLLAVALLPRAGNEGVPSAPAPTAIAESIPFAEVLEDAQAGLINAIEVDGTNLRITYLGSETAEPTIKVSKVSSDVDLETILLDQGISIGRGGSTEHVPAVDIRYTMP